jgi:hypothetical protein
MTAAQPLPSCTTLLKLGVPITDTEKSAKRFGDSTLAAVIELRKPVRFARIE